MTGEFLRHRNDADHYLNRVVSHVTKMNPHELCAGRKGSVLDDKYPYMIDINERLEDPVRDAMRWQIGTESTPNDARPPEQLAVPFDRGERA